MKAKIYDVSKNVKDIIQLEQINLIVTKESGQTVIDGGRILTDSILSKAIQAESILAKHLKANEITGDKIVAGTLEAKHLKAESITSELIASEAILAKNIKAENIESKHLKSDSILANHIKADEIDATKIKADAILAKHIKADEIDGTKIKAQSITVEHLTAGSILLPNENYGGVRINDEGLVSESSTIQTTLNATTGFAIYNKSAKKNIFKVNAENGEVEMNVTRLTISSGNVVKKDELEEIEDTLSLSVKSNENQFYLSTSPIVLSGGKWENEAPPWTSGYYMWQRAKTTLNNGTIYYSPSENGTCIAGAQGASATSYWITASNNIIGKSQTGVINPTTITFTGYSKTGTANSALYAGRFIIQTSTNGTSYTTRYTSSANQNAYTYTIPADTKFIKALFYQAGSTSVLLDEQTVPVVESAEGIQVGGRNLLLNSGNFKKINPWSGGIIDTKTFSFPTIKGTGTLMQPENIVLKPNTEYYSIMTVWFSKEVHLNSSVPNHIYVREDGAGNLSGATTIELVGGQRTSKVNEWERIVVKFKTKDTTKKLTFRIHLYNSNWGTTERWLKDAMVIEGNIPPTDWTPAPEDIQAELDDKASNEHVNIIKGDLEKLIGTTEEGIETRVSQKYVETNTFNAVSEKVTKMSQSIDGFDFTFDSKSLIDNLNEATGEAEKELQTIRKYIQFTSNGSIILGASDSPSKVEITRDKISFKQNDKEVAWFSNQSFNIESGTILTDLQVGDHKFEKSGTGRTRISYAKKNN